MGIFDDSELRSQGMKFPDGMKKGGMKFWWKKLLESPINVAARDAKVNKVFGYMVDLLLINQKLGRCSYNNPTHRKKGDCKDRHGCKWTSSLMGRCSESNPRHGGYVDCGGPCHNCVWIPSENPIILTPEER